MATSANTIKALLSWEQVDLSAPAIDLVTYYCAIPHTIPGFLAEYFCGTREGRVNAMADNLENIPPYQALTENGQTKCLHCMKRLGYFERAEGRVPVLMYARPCHEHTFLHPTSFNVGQWFLDFVDLQQVWVHNPRGGLAVLWVDMSLIGSIDVQLLRQDQKPDRCAGIDSYSFCNKIADLQAEHGHMKAKAVIAHVHVAMAMKWEPHKWATLEDASARMCSRCMEAAIQTDPPCSPSGVVDYRRRGLMDLPRGPRIVAVPVSALSNATLNLVDRVAELHVEHEVTHRPAPLRRTDSVFVGSDVRRYMNEGYDVPVEETPGFLTTRFSEEGAASETQSDGLTERSIKDAPTEGIGYVLEPPVKGGEVRMPQRGSDPKCAQKSGHERDIHRRTIFF